MKSLVCAIFLGALALTGCSQATPPPGAKNPVAEKAAEKARTAATLLEQGRAYADVGDSLRAQQYFSAAIKEGADRNVVLPLLLRACVAQKNYRLAVDYAETALARQPRNARLRLLTGTLYATIGDQPRSREQLERAADELSSQPDVQFTVAVTFRDHSGDVVSADKYFRRYLELAPQGEHAEEAKSSLMQLVRPAAPVRRTRRPARAK
jgi:tetratricopeptide (TPR) repeat protein